MRYGMIRLTPGVRSLMALTGAVFLLDMLVRLVFQEAFLIQWLGVVLKPRSAPFQTWLEIWRPFTYTLVHQDFFHLLWNMVGLFFLGAALEESIGTARLYRVYVVSGLAGALAAILAAWIGPEGTYVVGASGAVMGTMFAFIALYPNQTIMLWMLVLIPIRALYLGVIFFLIQFVSAFGGGEAGVSYFAHLGGIAAGVAMARSGVWFDTFNPLDRFRRKWRRRHLRPVPSRRSSPPAPTFIPNPPTAVEANLEKQVDAILDKVRQGGLDCLTDQERRTLDLHSTRLRHRDRS